jgi:hypothetical protein
MRIFKLLLLSMVVSLTAGPVLAAGAEFTIKLQRYYPGGMMVAEKQFADKVTM